ncbi:hypothetical protein KBY77_10665 [Synechococcus sp. Cruz-7E5]|nr:hypothetical protein [Synechococcus sp. Edmonson 11F2]MCP9863594.1 hypothetical protein [Synechococcus sp. Cruz-7E5]MCP9870790.1 hypothetical protein [Synechococcus sp. Cruz-7B9]
MLRGEDVARELEQLVLQLVGGLAVFLNPLGATQILFSLVGGLEGFLRGRRALLGGTQAEWTTELRASDRDDSTRCHDGCCRYKASQGQQTVTRRGRCSASMGLRLRDRLLG